jgi:hypothetical protein
MADTTIRLWHIGTYRYGWEDAGADRQRFGTFTVDLTQKPTVILPPADLDSQKSQQITVDVSSPTFPQLRKGQSDAAHQLADVV